PFSTEMALPISIISTTIWVGVLHRKGNAAVTFRGRTKHLRLSNQLLRGNRIVTRACRRRQNSATRSKKCCGFLSPGIGATSCEGAARIYGDLSGAVKQSVSTALQ